MITGTKIDGAWKNGLRHGRLNFIFPAYEEQPLYLTDKYGRKAIPKYHPETVVESYYTEG